MERGSDFKSRFDIVKNFWTQKVQDGEVPDSTYFQDTFYGPDTPDLRSSIDEQDLYNISKNMLATKNGDPLTNNE